MKVLDLHMTYKELYSNTIIIIKIGNFYETYDKDAIIINQITKYKLKYKNSITVGFPLISLDKVKSKLEDLHINYIIIEKTDCYKIISKKKFKDNNYIKYEEEAQKKLIIKTRIDDIYNNLTSYKNENINEILLKIENIIYER